MGVHLFDWRDADIVPLFGKVQGRDAPHDPAEAFYKRHRGLSKMVGVCVDGGDGGRVCEGRCDQHKRSEDEEEDEEVDEVDEDASGPGGR